MGCLVRWEKGRGEAVGEWGERQGRREKGGGRKARARSRFPAGMTERKAKAKVVLGLKPHFFWWGPVRPEAEASGYLIVPADSGGVAAKKAKADADSLRE
jgi:hypothetical protein